MYQGQKEGHGVARPREHNGGLQVRYCLSSLRTIAPSLRLNFLFLRIRFPSSWINSLLYSSFPHGPIKTVLITHLAASLQRVQLFLLVLSEVHRHGYL